MAGYSVTINAVDQASATIDKINKRLKAFTAPYERLGKSLGQFGNVSGLNRVGKAFSDIAGRATDAFRNVTKIIEPLAAITGAATLAGMGKLVSSWADWGSRLGFTAERIGTTAGRLNTLQNAARLAGVSAEAMTGGMTHLKDAMTDALGNRNSDAMNVFNLLGVSINKLHGTAESVMPQIIDKIGQLEKTNPTLAARITSTIFGSEELLRAFRGGMPVFQTFIDQARTLGGVTEEQAQKADSMRRSQVALTIAVEQFGYTLAAGLQPVLGPVIDFMTKWLSTNRDWLASSITGEVQHFVDAVKGADWKSIGGDVKFFADKIEGAVASVGGLKNATEIFLGLWTAAKLAPLISAVAATGPIGLLALDIGLVANAAKQTKAIFDQLRGNTGDENSDPASASAAARLPSFTPGLPMPTAGNPNGMMSHFNNWRKSLLARDLAGKDMAYFQSKGFTAAQAAGIEGNFFQESGLDATARENGGKGPGVGLGQWSDPKRKANFLRIEGTDIGSSTRQQQLDFTNWELNNTYKGAGDALRRQTTAGGAAQVFGTQFEQYGVEGGRVGFAEQFAAMPGGGAPAAQMASAAPGAAGASGHVHVTVSADPGTKAAVKSTSGNVKAAQNSGVSQTSTGTVYAT